MTTRDIPTNGSIYNTNGQNYQVTKCEPSHFLTLGADNEWHDAVEYIDFVDVNETATVAYVMALDAFLSSMTPGQIDEGASAEQLPSETPPEATQLPAETAEAEPKG